MPQYSYVLDHSFPTLAERLRLLALCSSCSRLMYRRTAPTLEYAGRSMLLLFGTCAQESSFTHFRQRGFTYASAVGGHSRWQLEEGSISDSLQALRDDPLYLQRATLWLFGDTDASLWIDRWSLRAILTLLDSACGDRLAVMFARMHYYRVSQPIPATFIAQAAYWKEHYNTIKGGGTAEEYVENWESLCVPVLNAARVLTP